jgi:integrase
MIKTAIIYNHRGRFGKDGTAPVEIRVTVGRRAYYVNTGVQVRAREWKLGQVVNRQDSEELNERVGIMLARVDGIINEHLKSGTEADIDFEDVRRHVKSPDKRKRVEDDDDMLAWMENEVARLCHSKGTLSHYRTLLARLAEYGQLRRWSDLSVESISRWDEWLHTIKKRQSNVEIKMKIPAKNISQGAVHNYHKNMRALLGRALKFGIIQSSPYERMRGDIERGDIETVEFLTDEERDRIEALTLTEGRVIAAARDMFMFQCYTGMAYSDMMAFSLKKCRQDGDAITYSAPRIKTGVWFYIQILPKARAVAEKYGGSMPDVCNEVFNRKLKDIAKEAGITKKLTTHVGRHTFATWALRNGVPIERLAKMLGHTKITQTQRYAKVLAQDVYAEFEKLK